MENTTLELLFEHSVNYSERVALLCKTYMLTYKEFWSQIKQCSQFLKTEGLKKGDIVLIKASQTPDYLVCYYGIQLAGAIPCSLERNTPSETVFELLDKMKAKMIISDCADDLKHDSVKTFMTDSVPELSANFHVSDSEVRFPDVDDTQIILFTTGTTGKSKGVEISYGSMQASEEKIKNFLHMETYAEKGLFVTPTPLNHAKGIWEVGGMLRSAGTICLLKNMTNLQEYFYALDYPCDKLLLSLVPANLRMLLMMAPDELRKRKDKIGGIKLGTAALLEHDKKLLAEILPDTELHNPYGSSEAGILCSYKFSDYPGLEFCIGKPLEGTEVLVVDENRNHIRS